MPLLVHLQHGPPGYITVLKYSFAILLPLFVHKQCHLFKTKDYAKNLNNIKNNINETFDFIIVGAGSAGAVVANRLSAPPNNYQVLLLEAGGNPSWITYFPGLDIVIPNTDGVDWRYKSVPQKNCCLSCFKKQLQASRGLGLGGCSNINFLVYNRGNPRGFDEWAEISGDPSWRYENVINYFKKSENYIGNYPNASVHGCGGELYVDGSEYQPGMEYFLQAIRDNGMVEQDINANQTKAFMKMDQTSKNGFRWGTYVAFLKPILHRTNLHINRYAFVTRLIFDPVTPTRVIGVEYIRHNVTKFAFASKEVILSAGSYNTPKILMLSGIGPEPDLENLGIPVVKHLPVGRTLQDHPTTLFTVLFNKSFTSSVYERDLLYDSLMHAVQPTRSQRLKPKGPIAGNSLLSTGYISTKYNDDVHWPDVQMFLSYIGISHLIPRIFGPLLNIHDSKFNHMLNSFEGKDGNMVLITLMRPRSIGYVTLNGTDPRNHPIISPNFFSDKDNLDMKKMVQGMKFMVEFFENSTAYKSIGAKLLPIAWPGCEHLKFKSLDYYECFIRHVTFSLWHPAGTCKMAKSDDPTAVVDSRLRVIDIESLRVVDSSIMSKITNGNTNAPAIMIGEKGSDMIIKDWGGYTTPPQNQEPCHNPPRPHKAPPDKGSSIKDVSENGSQFHPDFSEVNGDTQW